VAKNRPELDIEKAQEKCGTCGNWTKDINLCWTEFGRPFKITENSICVHNPSSWIPKNLNPEEFLERLRRKQRDIVGVDSPLSIPIVSSVIKNLESKLLQLQSKVESMQFGVSKLKKELEEKTAECETYMKLYQVFRLRNEKAKRDLDGKEG